MTPRRTEPVACASPMRRCPCRPAFFAQPSHRNAAPDPLHSVMTVNVPSLVGAGHAPPVGTSLLPETLRIAMDRNPIRRGRIAGHPRGQSGLRHVACPLCPATAANIPPSVGAGHAPPAGTSLPPETLWIAMDRNPIRRGRIAGHPCGQSGPQEHPPATPTPQWPQTFPILLSTLHSSLSTLHPALHSSLFTLQQIFPPSPALTQLTSPASDLSPKMPSFWAFKYE